MSLKGNAMEVLHPSAQAGHLALLGLMLRSAFAQECAGEQLGIHLVKLAMDMPLIRMPPGPAWAYSAKQITHKAACQVGTKTLRACLRWNN